MRVFKFGGASVRDAASVKNVHSIISKYTDKPLVVVVSAIGKTTNKFENLVNAHFQKQPTTEILEDLREGHGAIVRELFGDEARSVLEDIDNTLVEVEWALDDPEGLDFHFQYDQIVSIGEMLSTKIISAYLKSQGLKNEWVDARDLIRTDNNYQDAKIEWDTTKQMTNRRISDALKKADVLVTQGFIGGTSENFTTTLGREGSDFTAAILAYCLGAENVTIWKDVPGVLNADPKLFDNTVLIPEMSFFDAMELAYFGTSVIHPKTIKPLENAGIPLYVKSFLNPEKEGTIITETDTKQDTPSFISKQNQCLISIAPKDHSFVVENHLMEIFTALGELRIKSNVMQNSAISFSVCADHDSQKLEALKNRLSDQFEIRYNENCELITVRYFKESIIEKLTEGKNVLLEQRTRTSAQLVVE